LDSFTYLTPSYAYATCKQLRHISVESFFNWGYGNTENLKEIFVFALKISCHVQGGSDDRGCRLEVVGATLLDKRRYVAERMDTLRRLLMWEPRGHHDMYGALLVQPDHPGKNGKGSPYSTTERRVPELIPVLGSQPADDVSHKPCHYIPPGPQLPLQPLRGLLPVLLLGEQRHDGCEQFA